MPGSFLYCQFSNFEKHLNQHVFFFVVILTINKLPTLKFNLFPLFRSRPPGQGGGWIGDYLGIDWGESLWVYKWPLLGCLRRNLMKTQANSLGTEGRSLETFRIVPVTQGNSEETILNVQENSREASQHAQVPVCKKVYDFFFCFLIFGNFCWMKKL